jgi:hypothetical protein
MIQRHGDTFDAATSTDGKHFTLVPGSIASLPLPSVSRGGVTLSSGTQRQAVRAIVSALAVSRPTLAPVSDPSAHHCPSNFSCTEVGDPAIVGDQQLSGTTWTLRGAGFDIWNAFDQCHFVWQPLSGDTSVSAQVTAVSDANSGTKAGVMLRMSTLPDSAYYAVYVTPGIGVQVQFRDQAGDQASALASPRGTAPIYLRVTRTGALFSAFTSPDGVAWTQIAGSTIALPQIAGSLLGGIVLGSHDAQALATATFGDVTIG